MTIENSFRLFFKGVKIDGRTESYIRKRLEGLGKMLKKINHVEVEISLDKKGKFRVEIMVQTPYQLYRTEETSESIEGSTDIAVDELKNQIRKDTEKVRTLRLRGRRSIKKKTVIDKNARF
jgi:ribosomal subunit interface protein